METAPKKAVLIKNIFYFPHFSPATLLPLRQSHGAVVLILPLFYLILNTPRNIYRVFATSLSSNNKSYMPDKKGDGIIIVLCLFLFGDVIMNVSFPSDMCLTNNVSLNYDFQHSLLDSNMKLHDPDYLSIKDNDMKIELFKFPGSLMMNPLTPPESRPSSAPILENDSFNIDNLKLKVQLLLKNINELETHQIIKHIKYQLKYLVKYQKKVWNIPGYKHKRKKKSWALDGEAPSSELVDVKHTSQNIEDVYQKLFKHLKQQKRVVDPDATESSSESEAGEEWDTAERVQNKRNLRVYKEWLDTRAEIISTSMWLLSRVTSLEQTIRNYVEVCKHYHAKKKRQVYEPLDKIKTEPNRTLSSAVNEAVPIKNQDNSQQLKDFTEDYCARTLPLKKLPKRRLYRVGQYEAALKLPVWPNSCVCWCLQNPTTCILCNGDYDPSLSHRFDRIDSAEQCAMLEPYFHPALSRRHEVSTAWHISSLVSHKNPTFYNNLKKSYTRLKRPPVMRPPSLAQNIANSLLSAAKAHRRGRPLHTIRRGSLKRKRNQEEYSSVAPTRAPKRQRKRTVDQDGDLDELVCPYNMAPTPRFEKLVYKDIPIPKWRVTEENNYEQRVPQKCYEEDICEEAFERRHLPYEMAEKKKNLAYMGRHLKVNDTKTSDAVEVPPDIPPEPIEEWIIDPFPRREFPLVVEDFLSMVREPPTAPKACFPPDESSQSDGTETDGETEDPDDPEWTVLSSEKNTLILTLTRR